MLRPHLGILVIAGFGLFAATLPVGGSPTSPEGGERRIVMAPTPDGSRLAFNRRRRRRS